MTARPILFSAPMVRALLEGRKTQTRRTIKASTARGSFVLSFNHGIPEFNFGPDDRKRNGDLCWHRCPYGQPGDLLWVRETFRGARGYDALPPSKWGNKPIWYPADGEPDAQRWGHLSDSSKPGIHMPRWASRLTLRITNVRVQQLQDCSHADAVAEGVGDLIEYGVLWESINGPGSWQVNPWVWALTFEVIKANVDQVAA